MTIVQQLFLQSGQLLINVQGNERLTPRPDFIRIKRHPNERFVWSKGVESNP